MNLSHFSLILVLFASVAVCDQCKWRKSDCPNYTVKAKHTDYEERLYPALTWISSSEKAKSRKEVSWNLIRKIYGYIGGANKKDLVMEMMVPFRTTKIPGEQDNTYIISIALTSDYQNDPPVPNDSSLTVSKEPPRIYYARSFGGLAKDESIWDKQAQLLRNSLGQVNAANTTFYYWAVYDNPWISEGRLNEVWLSPSQKNSE